MGVMVLGRPAAGGEARSAAFRWGRGVAGLVGVKDWVALPPRVRARFDHRAAALSVVGTGWFEANAAGRLFARIGVLFGRPLPCRIGAAEVAVEARTTPEGQVWTRRYRFARGVETVISTKQLGRGPWLEERAGLLVMRMKIFREGETLAFESFGFLIRLGRFELPIPDLFTPGRMRMTHEASSARAFTFTLEARHPWFGVTFREVCYVEDAD